MNKKKIIYFSDHHFFAGCESMIPNFLNSKKIKEFYEISFVYRNIDNYEKELISRLNEKNNNLYPVNLPKQQIHNLLLNRLNRNSLLYKFFSLFIIPIWKYLAIFLAVYPLYKKFYKHSATILHINNGGYPGVNTSYSAVIAAKLAGINNVVYMVNNIAADYKSPLRWLDWFLDIYVKKNVDMFVTGSKNAGLKLTEILNLPFDKIINIPNGILPRIISKEKEDFLKSLNINLNDRLLFSTIALLQKNKGHIWLLKAIRLLKNSYKTLPLLIIEGDGSEREFLEKFILKNNLNEDVKLIGSTTHIFNLLNASDVIVLPSIGKEDFPNVIIEAMSIGKPTIGTRIAGIPEQIEDNINGFLVEPKNEKELAIAIHKFMDTKIINSFSKKAKEKFDLNYKVEISLEKYFKLYQKFD